MGEIKRDKYIQTKIVENVEHKFAENEDDVRLYLYVAHVQKQKSPHFFELYFKTIDLDINERYIGYANIKPNCLFKFQLERQMELLKYQGQSPLISYLDKSVYTL